MPFPTSRRRRRGTTTVEFAFVVPLFFLFVLVLIEFGRGMMVTNLLHNAAREGCRQGILGNKSDSDITAAVDNALKNQGISDRTITITVNNKKADASTANSGDEITVVVTAPVAKVTWLPVPQHLAGNLTARFTANRE
jgi:Flp pilus assembly protein TadG